MDTIKDFIVQNWQFISSAILAVLTIIAMLVKKKPQTLDDFVLALHQALMDVPYFIQKVEHSGDGSLKKLQVQQLTLDKVKEYLRRSLTKTEINQSLIFIEDAIEEILSCPTKKGGNGRESK